MANETDFVRGLRQRANELKAIVDSNRVAKLQATYDQAKADQDRPIEVARELAAKSRGSPTYRNDPAANEEQQRLWAAVSEANSQLQAAVREHKEATSELAEIGWMLNSGDAIKAERRNLADAHAAAQDLRETIASHNALLAALPGEIETIATQRDSLLSAHAKAEAAARTKQGAPLPAFPAGVRDLDLTIESKRRVAASAKDTLDEANAALPAVRDNVATVRARLQRALHARNLLAWRAATANLGPLAAALHATDRLGSKDELTVVPTEAQIVEAEATLATELAQ